ncbi:Trm112 family protein [bacterium]|nr:Trm112 family protein [bacterium]
MNDGQSNRLMLENLVCPVTQGTLKFDKKSNELISSEAKLAFPIRGGIPIMLIDEARKID